MQDELQTKIRQAVNEALGEAGLAENVRITDILPHPDSDRYSVHLRKAGVKPEYLFIPFEPIEALTDVGGAGITVASLKKQAYRELGKHFPNLN